jgi:hypothetical protein
MPPADMPFHRGFAVDPALQPGNHFFHHHERWLNLHGNSLDDAVEAQASSWESLWIDMGGEG